MAETPDPYTDGKSLDELVSFIVKGGAEPGSPVHEGVVAAIQVRIAEMQRDTARDALRWARMSTVGTILATAIALAAFLVAVL